MKAPSFMALIAIGGIGACGVMFAARGLAVGADVHHYEAPASAPMPECRGGYLMLGSKAVTALQDGRAVRC